MLILQKMPVFTFLMLLICMSLFSFPTLLFDDLSFKNMQEGGSLHDWKGQPVEVRGFWYPLTDETGILAPHPHLKSCCLQASSKLEQQLFVKGVFAASLPSQRAVSLEGIFNIQPAYNQKGELIQLFVLENAREVSGKTGSLTWWIIGGVLVLILLRECLKSIAAYSLRESSRG